MWRLCLLIASAVQGKLLSTWGESVCFIQPDAKLYCIGMDSYGTFGGLERQRYTFPVELRGVDAATDVAHGGDHTCIVDHAAVKCVGRNWYGQLGDNSFNSQPRFVNVKALPGPVSNVYVSPFQHTCALLVSGGVRCWGEGSTGQMANQQAVAKNALPVAVYGYEDSGVVQMALGFGFTCIATNKGEAKCAGTNSNTQSENQLEMTQVFGLETGVVSIESSGHHVCVIVAPEGGVFCWGENFSGALGNGQTVSSHVPVQPIGLQSGVASIGFGNGATTYAVMQSGGAVKWFGVNPFLSDTDFDPEDDGLDLELLVGSSDIPMDFHEAKSGIREIQGRRTVCSISARDLEVKCMGYGFKPSTWAAEEGDFSIEWQSPFAM